MVDYGLAYHRTRRQLQLPSRAGIDGVQAARFNIYARFEYGQRAVAVSFVVRLPSELYTKHCYSLWR